MSIKISDLFKSQVSSKFDFNGKTIEISYNPNYLTPLTAAELQGLADKGDHVEFLVKGLSGQIVEWDLADDNGKILPIEEKTLKRFPLVFLAALQTHLNGEVSPKKEQESSFGVGS
jgi:hypothetical protein